MNKPEYEKKFELWKVAIDTQMHFNDLIMKIRAVVTSIITTIFGASAIVLSQSDYTVSILNRNIHISVLIIIGGLVLLLAHFLIDLFYYFQLLLGAVECSKEIEEQLSTLTLTTNIRKQVPKSRAYVFLILYYLLPIIAFSIILILILR